MVGSKSYRDRVQSGINWRKSLESFNTERIGRRRKKLKRVKKETALDFSEWSKGFNIGYMFQRRNK